MRCINSYSPYQQIYRPSHGFLPSCSTMAATLWKRMSKSKKKSHSAEVRSEGVLQQASTSAPTAATTPATTFTATSENRRTTDNPNVMEEELSRLRMELSRVTSARDRHEMEAAKADAELCHYKEECIRASALKTEADGENRRLQVEGASFEREKSRLVSEAERLKEELERTKEKLSDKKRAVTELKTALRRAEEEKEKVERSAKDREQTWQTIRRDVSTKRDDAIRDSCKMRRDNEKLQAKIKKLKTEKSSILIRLWEKKQREVRPTDRSTSRNILSGSAGVEQDIKFKCRPHEESLRAKVLSLELQLFRQARLVELLLDVIQTNDPQFTAEQRSDLTSAFADAGSIPELLSQKLKFL